jgi:hypothetical protein
LRLLTQGGFTESIRLTVCWASENGESKGGRIPTLFALTDDGARIVEERTGERPQRVLRSAPSPATFLHRSEIVRVMRAFDLACDRANVDRPQWVMEQDPWPSAAKTLPPNQRRLLSHEFGKGLSCNPDIACRLRIGSTELVLYWEVDLSTEGRKQIRKATKTDGYVALFNGQGWRRYWPDLETNRRYVIWVTPTARRIRSLQETFRDLPIAPLCRFIATTDFSSPDSLLLSTVWETVTGERRPMYRPTPK